MTNNFDEICSFLPSELSYILIKLPEKIKYETFEIRLRVNKPVILFGKYGKLFAFSDSGYSHIQYNNSLTVSKRQLDDIVTAVCGYSVYSHQNEIASGFVTFGKGNRAGFGGTAVCHDNKITSVRNITCVNIRVGSDNHGIPEILEDILKSFNGIIISGPPCSGKTTLLKEIARSVSSEYKYGFLKTAVIDERFELGFADGINCDMLKGYNKKEGIIHAVRTLSPEVIICDEITKEDEIDAVLSGIDSGVRFIVSMHSGDEKELVNRKIFRNAVRTGSFDSVIMLEDRENAGKIKEIYSTEELINVACSSSNNDNFSIFSLQDCS